MAAIPGTDGSAGWRRSTGGPAEDATDDVLRPIIAGSFARGIAEAFELLGVPALFFDPDGRVIFASAPAKPLLANDLSLRAGHLLAEAAGDKAALATFVADVLRDPAGRTTVTLAVCGIKLEARPVPGDFAPVDQLLHAIVLLSRTT